MNTMSKNCQKYMPTYILIALNIIVYICTSIIGGDFITTGDRAIFWFGQVNYLVIYYGWYWQLFTSMFVHASIVHLFGNMLFLLIFGLRAEEMFSIQEYLLTYFLSGLAGNLLSLGFGPFSAPEVPFVSVGASGAIFGVFGACIIYVRRAVGQSIMTALMYAFFLFMMNIGPNVNFLAHLGGLVVGLCIGYVLGASRRHAVKHAYSYRYSYSPRS
jgi:rhomboid protease GluP